MNEPRRPGRSTLVTRFLIIYGAAVAGLVAVWSVAIGGWTAPMVALGSLAVALGAAIVFLVATRLSRRIRDLTEIALAAAAGEPRAEPVQSSIRELDSLGAAVGGISRGLGTRLEQAESEGHTLGTVLSALTVATILIDPNGHIDYANPASQDLLGATPDHLRHLVPHPLQILVARAFDEKTTVVEQIETGRPTRLLRASATPMEGGQVLLVVADITERARTDAIRRDFVANASHELKTPIAAILAAAETLKIALARDIDSTERFADQIEGSARHLNRLVSDLLDLSRLETDRPTRERVRLDHVAGDELARLTPVAEEKGVALVKEMEEAWVEASPPDLGLAIRNLLDNAIRYTPPGGEVRLEVGSDSRGPLVKVEDNGEGIPSRDIPRIFERFYRVDTARSRATGGTGLGLAIVKHIAEGHGGEVSVESELGRGSTFTLRVPAWAGE